MEDKDLVIAGLIESNDILQQEVTKVRNSNRILRTVVRALRTANESLRRTVEIAQQNDETFKDLCEGKFDAEVSCDAEDGLSGSSHEVEPLG
jgi:FtsZ-binding cell division protein ZapB